jgi:WD40 repeat protein
MDTSEFQLNVAVVIGINDYQNNISQLSTARQDAEAIARLLETEYQYQVILITDATEIQPSFDRLHQFFEQDLPDRIQSPQSTRLIFYFAGHGIAEGSDRGPSGYLIPQNAKLGDVATYLSMQFVHDSLSRLACHHLLVILDCCFGGAFRWANSRHLDFIDSGKVYKQHYEYFTRFPAWQVITSAAHDQKALDLSIDRRNSDEAAQHSPFALALLEGLGTSQADLIRDGVITTHELYVYLQDRLTKLFGAQQTPGIWPLKPDYDRGEFIFTSSDFNEAALADAPPIDTRSNPYRGLKSFEERHADLFFGRDVLVGQLFGRLSRTLTQGLSQDKSRQISQKLLIVLGVSGSGKSSLVKAGLLPKLRSQVEPKWCVLTPMRPGRSPFSSLAQVILPIVNEQYLQQLEDCKFLDQRFTTLVETKTDELINPELLTLADTWLKETSESKLLLILNRLDEFKVPAICSKEEFQQLADLQERMEREIETLQSNLQEMPQCLTTAIQIWRDRNPAASLVLVIDQLEELVTMMPSTQNATSRSTYQTQIDNVHQSEWWRFLEVLRLSLENTSSPLHIVLTLRSDFEPRFYKTPLQDYWKEACFYIDDMSSEELRLAIEKPALKQAIYFDPPELVSRLVDDVRKMPGALPLLSFTLSELHRTLQERWRIEKSTDRALRNKDYEALGGVTKSLANRATQEYENLVQGVSKAEGERLQGLMRQVLRRMVSLDGGGARRRVLSSELTYPNDQDNQAIAEILKRLVDNRLVVAGQDGGETYYEPAHDSLVVHWIQEWMTPQAKEELALQRLLTPAAREWRQKKTSWIEEHRSWSRITTYPVGKIWQGINHLWDHRESYTIAKIQQKSQVREDSNPKRFLWNGNPRLILLKLIFFSKFNNWLNENESQFVRTSVFAKRKNTFLQWSSIFSGTTILLSLTAIAILGQHKALIREIEAYRLVAEEDLISHYYLDALVNGIRATKPLETPLIKLFPPDKNLQNRLEGTLQKALYRVKELNRWNKHKYEVFTAKFTLDGKYLISGGYDQSLHLLQLNENSTGSEYYTHHRQKNDSRGYAISSSAFSRDGTKLATADFKGFIHIWNYKNGSLAHQTAFSINNKTIRSLAISPTNANLLASASFDGTVQLWDLSIGKPLSSILKAHQGKNVEDVDFSSDGKLLATAGRDGITYIYQVEKNLVKALKPLAKCSIQSEKRENNSEVYSVQFNPNNPKRLLTAGSKGAVYLWDLEAFSCKQIITFKGHDTTVRSASFSPKNDLISTSGDDGSVRLWDLKGNQLHEFRGHEKTVYEVNFSPDGDRLVTAGRDGTVRLWSFSQFLANIKDIKISTSISRKVKFSSLQSATRYVAIAQGSGGFQVWQLDQASNPSHKICEKSYDETGHTGLVLSLAFSSDGKILAVGGEDGKVSFWSLQDQCGKQATSEIMPEQNQKNEANNNNITGLQFHPGNGNFLAATVGDGTVWLWKIKDLDRKQLNETLKQPLIFHGHQGQALNLSFSPSGGLLVTVGNDGAVRVWNADRLQKALIYQSVKTTLNFEETRSMLVDECPLNHQDWVEGISFHPNGNIFATSDAGSTILLWNIQNNKQRHCQPLALNQPIKRFEGDVYDLSFSPDGYLLAAGYKDGAVRLWGLDGELAGEILGSEVSGADQQIYSVSFDSETRSLAIVGKSKTVRFWKIPKFDDLLSQSCDRVKDYLQHNPNASEVRHICDGIGSTPK